MKLCLRRDYQRDKEKPLDGDGGTGDKEVAELQTKRCGDLRGNWKRQRRWIPRPSEKAQLCKHIVYFRPDTGDEH